MACLASQNLTFRFVNQNPTWWLFNKNPWYLFLTQVPYYNSVSAAAKADLSDQADFLSDSIGSQIELSEPEGKQMERTRISFERLSRVR